MKKNKPIHCPKCNSTNIIPIAYAKAWNRLDYTQIENCLAYKDIDVVMENQNDLVDVVRTLKQVVCVKG